MYTFILQDWLFLECGPGENLEVVQSESCWLDVGPAKDIVFWLQVASADDGGDAGLALVYETAPIKDNGLFKPIADVVALSGPETTPLVTPVFKASSSVDVPVGNWVRWRLEQPHSDQWHVEFRILCSVNPAYPLDGSDRPGLSRETGREATHETKKCGGCS